MKEPCYCGATDCPECGPAQGYRVYHKYDPVSRGYVWVNPEDEDDSEDGVMSSDCLFSPGDE